MQVELHASAVTSGPTYDNVQMLEADEELEVTVTGTAHKLAKLSSLFYAFRKCLKLQNWYQNVLLCL